MTTKHEAHKDKFYLEFQGLKKKTNCSFVSRNELQVNSEECLTNR